MEYTTTIVLVLMISLKLQAQHTSEGKATEKFSLELSSGGDIKTGMST